MKKRKLVFSASLDERINLPVSFQVTEDMGSFSHWRSVYIGFIFWNFEFLFVDKDTYNSVNKKI